MRIIQVDFLKENDCVGKSIYSDNGSLLLAEGVQLSEIMIDKLHEHCIEYIYIDDEVSKGIEPKSTIDDMTMRKSVRSIKATMNDIMKYNSKGKMNGYIPLKHYQAVRQIVDDILNSLEKDRKVLYTVTELMSTDMYTYKHSINVAILSILTARVMHYDDETVRSIAMGGLLHDIGKTLIKTEIINKPDVLTEAEFKEIKNHPEYGYQLVREDVAISPYAKQIIRFHHEKMDGSGYGMGLNGNGIPEHVRLVTICDMFDAMTMDRAYRKRMPPHRALENLMADAVYQIDANIYREFVDNICIFPEGTGVELSDGRRGVILEYRHETPTRPKIRIVNDPVYEVDLEKDRTLFINSIIDFSSKE